MHFSHALRSGHTSIKIWSYYLKFRKSSYFVMLVVITLVRARSLVFLKILKKCKKLSKIPKYTLVRDECRYVCKTIKSSS